jgi:hypothetical protein
MVSPLKALAAISFSLGSVLVLAEVFVDVVVRERSVAWSISPAHWGPMGIIGALGWVAGIALLVYLKLSGPRSRRDRKNVFLAGRERFKCSRCSRTIDAKRVGFHQRMECKCGAIYNVFQETEWEREDL